MADKKSFVLRVDPAVYDAMERWAADEFRSVNGQIESLLKAALLKHQRDDAQFCRKCRAKK